MKPDMYRLGMDRPSGLVASRVHASAAIAAVALLVSDHFWRLNHVAVGLAAALLTLVVVHLVVSRARAGARADVLVDPLTGLGNRAKLMLDLREEIELSSISTPRILLLLDLDGFKHYNDSFGHPAGDALLERLGQSLSTAVGAHGHAYRIGGDEFCALLRTETARSERLVAAAVAALSEHGRGFDVRSSYGIVTIPEEADEPSEALRIADRRMYAQKRGTASSVDRQTHEVLLRVLREREPELSDHGRVVSELAAAVGRRLALPAEEIDELIRAADLHDVGKMAIPDAILHKPGPLDRDEWGFMHRHTIVGERILSAAPALLPVGRLVRSSHERFDGGGYPDRLEGDSIPLGARIVAACDAFDAMVSPRPYREPVTPSEALAELRRCAGTQFDPGVIDALCDELTSAPSASPQAAAPLGS